MPGGGRRGTASVRRGTPPQTGRRPRHTPTRTPRSWTRSHMEPEHGII